MSKNSGLNPGPVSINRGMPEASACAPAYESQSRLDVVVLFTGLEPTFRALQTANHLACDLNARIRLVVPEVVPYQLPIDAPSALPEFSERRFKALAARAAAAVAETRVEIYLCRDRNQALAQALQPGSTVVIGAGKPWWPGWERRVAWQLRRAGHQVIFTIKSGQGESVYA